MIRVIAFSLYGPMAASHRVRLGQYRHGLSDLGISLQINSLLDDDYLLRRSQGKSISLSMLLKSYNNRFKLLFRKSEFDAAIIYCELFPFLPAFIELKSLSIPYIYDFDDAWYLRYQRDIHRSLQFLLKPKIGNIIRSASVVTAGSQHLANYARTFNSNVIILPSSVDIVQYRSLKVPRDSVFTVGWIGSFSTSIYLRKLIKPLSIFGLERRVRLLVIGGEAPMISNIEVSEIPWSLGDEIRLLNTLDVGLMPLPDDEWAEGKCAFKLVQYMSCCIPVIASPVGANIDLVTKDCGILAETDEEWVSALRWMHDHPFERQKMGDRGRDRVEKEYSLQSNLPIVARVIRQIVNLSQ